MIEQEQDTEATDERPSNGLPQGWVIAKVGDFCKLVGGGTPSTANEKYWQGNIPWISSADIEGIRNIRPRRAVTEQAVRESATNIVPAGSVIVVTRVGLGKVALVPEPLCFSQDSQALVFNVNLIDPLYLTHYLKSAVQVFKHISRGTTINGVTKKQLEQLNVALPPLNEQRRIVTAIEQQFSRIDAGITALKQVRAKLKRYRAAALKAAVEGTLTEAWRAEHADVESASTLLGRILDERRKAWEQAELARFAKAGKTPSKGWQAKYREPESPDTTNLPTLPEGWCWAAVSQLAAAEANSITDGPFGSNLKTEHYASEGPRVIRLQNIGNGAFKDDKAYISFDHFQTLRKHEVFTGDLVIAALGDNPPRSCIIPDYVGPAIVKADCIRFKTSSFVLNSYANYALNSEPTRRRTATLIHGIGRPRLNLSEIKSMTIPLPPLAEQEQIVAEVERRLSVVAETEAQVAAELRRAERLRQGILALAFAGRLVPQDPTDEPAGALLERIRAEKGRAKGGKGKPEGTARNHEEPTVRQLRLLEP